MTAPAATLERVAWTAVCPLADLTPGRGITALVGGTAVAVFRLTGDEVAAIAARDPFCGANVLGRGLLGSTGNVRYVASPMYKERFDLATGVCLDDPAVRVAVYPVRVTGGLVHVCGSYADVPPLAMTAS
jgi:nitrite reductase (NADH) small subunit